MSTVKSVMAELKKKGTKQTRDTLIRHGAPPDKVFGVKVADLKVIVKMIKSEQELACGLYDTGNMDAMYLAGLVADGAQMTKKQLDAWAKAAGTLPYISEYTVAWVAGESPHASELALKWMKSKTENIAASGWCTYAAILGTTPDEELDFAEIKNLLNTVVQEIDAAQNRVRYTMNGFVIAVGLYVKPLLKQAKAAAKKIGVVSVDVGDTACKVPLATAYIDKNEAAGRVGKKRKTFKC